MIEAVGLVGIIYMTVAANFLGVTLSNDLQNMLRESVIARHCTLLFGAMFWVATLVKADDDFAKAMLKVLLVYVLFVMSTFCRIEFILSVLVLLIIDQGCRIYVSRSRNSNIATVTRVRHILQCTIVALICTGFALSRTCV